MFGISVDVLALEKNMVSNLDGCEVARPLSSNLKGGWSSRQGCDPAGESPAETMGSGLVNL